MRPVANCLLLVVLELAVNNDDKEIASLVSMMMKNNGETIYFEIVTEMAKLVMNLHSTNRKCLNYLKNCLSILTSSLKYCYWFRKLNEA